MIRPRRWRPRPVTSARSRQQARPARSASKHAATIASSTVENPTRDSGIGCHLTAPIDPADTDRPRLQNGGGFDRSDRPNVTKMTVRNGRTSVRFDPKTGRTGVRKPNVCSIEQVFDFRRFRLDFRPLTGPDPPFARFEIRSSYVSLEYD
jgi:hypothetical protein